MNLYAIVIALITLTLLGVSLARLRNTRTKADFLVANRSLSAFVLVFTLLSSWIGSGSLLGGAENAYRHGFAALWQGAGGWGGLLLIYFIAPRARKFAQYTIPDLLEARYNQTARILGVIAILFTYTAITSYQFIGGGDILHLIFPTVVTPHPRPLHHRRLRHPLHRHRRHELRRLHGRLHRPTRHRDHAASPFPSSPIAPVDGPPSTPLSPLPTSSRFGDLTGIQAIELFLPTCLLLLGNQSMYQKFFSAKSEKAASQAVVGWIIGTVILETVIVAIAVVGSALFPTGEVAQSPREILAYVGLHAFSGGSACP